MAIKDKFTYEYTICPNCKKKILLAKTKVNYHAEVPPEEAEEAF